MGYMRHHAIVVTTWSEERIRQAHEMAKEFSMNSSGIVKSGTNGYASFLVPPDGSKEGWDESDAGDRRRETFVAWLKDQAVDGGSYFDWAEIQYGDDNRENRLLSSESDVKSSKAD